MLHAPSSNSHRSSSYSSSPLLFRISLSVWSKEISHGVNVLCSYPWLHSLWGSHELSSTSVEESWWVHWSTTPSTIGEFCIDELHVFVINSIIVVRDLPYKYGAMVFIIGCFGGFSGQVLAFLIYLLYLIYGDIDFSLKTICRLLKNSNHHCIVYCSRIL